MTDVDAIAGIAAHAVKMKEEGIRRLLVLSGDADWTLLQAEALRQQLGGDGLWVGETTLPEPHCLPGALKTWLGRESHHAFFDARLGFDVSAFAALAGTLKAGSWLVLLTPDLTQWSGLPDLDAGRWSDSAEPVITPHFIHHFLHLLGHDREVAIWRQGSSLLLPEETHRPAWQMAKGEPLAEQQQILTALSTMQPGVAVVTAERGRGKSALAGMHLHSSQARVIVTAPTKAATDVLAAFAGETFRFMAPDALLASSEQVDWLIADEAAAIPGPLLEVLVRRFPRTLLTTTVQGYEGTGRGFLLKLCARFPHLQVFTLEQPVRWAAGCPLERFVARALLFDDTLPVLPASGILRIQRVEQSAWCTAPYLPDAMYRLLSAAHYRTSPLDLRRMMDAPGQHFACALLDDTLAGAIWLVEEGGLTPSLSQAVWAGYRRPRGNLVAQSLAAHGGSPLAATLRGRRISRIAVHPQQQDQGIGQQLVAAMVLQSRDCDYLSVSFGFTDELWRFWQRCGFRLVRLGTHREASSGCYTAMALYPLTSEGHALVEREVLRMTRDEHWLAPWRDTFAESPLRPNCLPETILTDADWQELAGFAFAQRPLMSVVGSLNRLLMQVVLPLPALRKGLQRENEAALCQSLKLSGRKALLAAQRQEAASALALLDAQRCQQLADKVAKIQFF